MTSRSNQSGFTLMELIMVVVVLGLIASAIVPLYSGSIRKTRAEVAIDHFVRTMEYARDRSVMASTQYRFYFDEDENRYWVMRERLAEREGGDINLERLPDAREDYLLPESIEITIARAERDRDIGGKYIAFYPSGACDFAKVALRIPEERRTITIETEGMLGRFKVSGDT